MDFNERIERLAELEGKATQGEWEEYDLTFGGNVIKKSIYAISHTLEQNITDFDDPQADINRALICTLRNEALPLLREMQAENERLREGIGRAMDCLKRDCESFGELSSAVCDAQEQLEALHDA